MASRKVAPEYLEKVKLALHRSDYSSHNALAINLKIGRSTIKSFLKGESVHYLNFEEICKKLGLEWKEIAYQEPETPPIQNRDLFTL